MIPCLHQCRDDEPNRLDRGTDIRILLCSAPVVQADNTAIARILQHAIRDRRCRQFPVETDHRPHHAGEPQSRLHFAKSEPAHAEGRTHEPRRNAGGFADRRLRAGKIRTDQGSGLQSEIRMRIRMIPDLMPGADNRPGNLRMPLHIRAHLKKGSPRARRSQNIEKQRSRRRRPVIERERNSLAPRRTTPPRRTEHRRRTPSRSPASTSNAGPGNERHRTNHAYTISSWTESQRTVRCCR